MRYHLPMTEYNSAPDCSPPHRSAVSHSGAKRFSDLLPGRSILCAVLALVAARAAHADAPTPERQRELVHLVRQDCGSCHGMTLRGGLGPSLRPDALHDKPAEALVATIYGGRPGTPMPPWKRFMTEAEASWIVDQLLKGFPD